MIEVLNFDEARRVVGHLSIDVIVADMIAAAPGPESTFAFGNWIRTSHPEMQVLLAATSEKATSNAGEVGENGPVSKKPLGHQMVFDRITQALASQDRSRF